MSASIATASRSCAKWPVAKRLSCSLQIASERAGSDRSASCAFARSAISSPAVAGPLTAAFDGFAAGGAGAGGAVGRSDGENVGVDGVLDSSIAGTGATVVRAAELTGAEGDSVVPMKARPPMTAAASRAYGPHVLMDAEMRPFVASELAACCEAVVAADGDSCAGGGDGGAALAPANAIA